MRKKKIKERKLAELLHSRFCHRNHVEHCAWEYEEGYKGFLWEQREHKIWLQKAKNIVKVATYTVEEALKALKLVGNIEKDLYKRQR